MIPSYRLRLLVMFFVTMLPERDKGVFFFLKHRCVMSLSTSLTFGLIRRHSHYQDARLDPGDGSGLSRCGR